jgi:uncharacterized repeat protein (TIGR01451 family)
MPPDGDADEGGWGMTRWPVRWLALVVGLVWLLAPSPARAQVQTLDAWSNPAVIQDAPGTNGGTASVAGQTVSAGTNRILIVAVVMELSASDTLRLFTVSFGTVTMTPLARSSVGNGGSTAQEHAGLFYLLDSQIPAGAQTLSVTYDVSGGGPGSTTVTALHAYWGSYSGVDQANPLVGSAANAADAPNVTFGSAVSYVANGRLVYAAGNGFLFSTMSTVPAGFAQIRRTGANFASSYIAETAVEVSGGTYDATTTVGFTTVQNRSSVAVASLRPAATSADLSVTKTDGAATYVPGATTTYTIVASNAGPSAVTGATLTDTFPAIVTSANWSCTGAGGATCPASGSGSIAASVNLPVGGTVTFTVTVVTSPTATVDLVNTATIAAPAGTTDPTPGNNSATDTDPAAPRADLSVTKTDGATTYAPGGTTTYTIVASNGGPSAVTGATLADTFPAIVTGANWTCAGAGGATCPASGSGNIAASVNLPVGGTVTFTVTVVTSPTATVNLVNTATIAVPAGTTDPTTGNNSATDTDTPAPQADLSVTKTGTASGFSGDPAAYTITFTNNGPSTVTAATIADTFPAQLLGATWTCAATGGAACPAASGVGNVAASVNLPSGGRLTYTATATIDPTFTGSLVNTATITAPGGPTDPVPGNNSASVTTVVVAQTQVADVRVTKTGPTGPLPVGSNVTYTITVGNNGPATAQNVLLSDPLPAGTTWVSTTTSVGTCSGAGTVSCAFGRLASGATATVTIVVTINSVGTKSNTATVSNPNGSDYDPDLTNNSSTWLTTVSGAPTCGTPGGPGPGGTLSGIINTYYPGTASVGAGQANTCIPVGAARGASATLTSGDLLLVIQMQDATIDSSNSNNYGGAVGTGAGALVVNAGRYEYVVARDVVGGGGCTAGQIPVTGTGTNGGLLDSYANTDATTTKGQARYQVVRVPQYSTATLAGVTALPWTTDNCNPAGCSTNGLGWGGIVALDVSGTLTINGGPAAAANVDGLGFRGAAGRLFTGGAGANTDYRTLSTNPANGGKGEGNAGTPEWIYDAAGTSRAACTDPALNTYIVQTFQPNDGYPNGSMARGAPGNAGGGSTDGNPGANDQNSGGGGGSNGGAGGRGGFSWNSGLNVGGLGAAVVPTISQLVLGGGGGAGTRNNSNCGGPDPVTAAQDAQASSGAAGGGLIAIRAGTLSIGAGAVLSANGAAAYNDTLRDGGGGGGAGGSIVLTVTNAALDMSGLTLRANGGRGGDAWRGAGGTANRHGPGGGGGGGVIAYSATTVAPTLSVTGGAPGITSDGSNFGALAGGTGQTLTATPAQIPGAGSGAECPPPDPDPTIVLTHSETTVSMGGPISVYATVTNVSPFTSTVGSPTYGVVTATITLDPGLVSLSVASAPGWSCSVAGQVVTCTRSSALPARESYPTIQIDATVGSSVVGPTTLTNTATVAGGGDVNLANNNATDTVGVRAPTLAHLRSFEALKRGRAVVLRWRTSYELNNLGFRVYRETAAGRERITPRILAGSALAVGKDRPLPSGRTYAWIDHDPVADARYWLEDVDLDGTRQWSGPVVAEDGPGESGWGPVPVFPSPALADLGRDRARPGRWEGPRGVGMEHRARFRRDGKGSEGLEPWTAPSRRAAKIRVAREGWYRVTKRDLLAAGFDPGTVPSNLRLLADGVEQAILVRDGADGSFDAGDSIEFYGVGFDSPWDGAHVYWLVADDRPGLRIEPGQGDGAPFPPAPSSFPFTVELRERTVQIFALLGTADEDNFYGAVVTPDPVVQQLTLTNIDRLGSGGATVEIALQGSLDTAHRVEVQLNGSDVGTIDFPGRTRIVETLAVPVESLREGANDVTLVARGGDEDISLVDYVRITYPHRNALDDGALRMTAPGFSRVTLGGLTDRSLRVVDVSQPTRPRELSVSFASDGSDTSASVAVMRRGEATLYAFTPERVLSPERIEVNVPSSLSRRDNAADFLIIGHPSLLSRLEPLRQLRQQQGLSTSLVDVTDVYDEFAYGQKTPYAIRDFLQRAALGWRRPPHYVLLAGDASFDPRNYLGEGDFDLVPTKLVHTTYMKTDSDDWFVDWDQDGLPEMAIGRLPARTAEEAATMVAKILSRDAALGGGPGTPDWARRVLLVTGPPDEYDFPSASARLRALVPPDVAAEEVAIGPLGPGAARGAIVSGFDAGQLLVNFSGHGSIEVWMERSDGGLVFGDADAAGLTNAGALPFVVSMTCLNGLFDDLWTESLAEALLKAPDGGAAAVWASSGLTEPSSQSPMNEELFRLLFGGAPMRLGDATVRAKRGTSDIDVRRTWILFGDPTMRLR